MELESILSPDERERVHRFLFERDRRRCLVSRGMLRTLLGRYLDVLLTHAPPRGIHDEPDLCHTGFEAFNWLVRRFQPAYHLHGHIHLYDRRAETVTRFGATEVMNVYPYRELTLTVPISPSDCKSR